MPAGKLSNVISAKPNIPAGGLLKGGPDTVPPTDAKSPLTGASPLGFVTDKGVNIKPTVSTTKKKAWGGSVIRVLTTDASAEMSFALAEFLSEDSLEAIYGEDNVTFTAATADHGNLVAVRFKGELPPVAPYFIEAKDGKQRIRVYVPNFQVTDQGDFAFDDNSTIDMDVKGEAYPDEDGVLFYIFTDDGATV